MKNENAESTSTESTETVKGTGINWSKVAVRDPHGAIDQEATLALCNEELSAHIAENEVDMGEIGDAVASAFAEVRAKAQKAMIDLNGLASRALNALGTVTSVPFGAETRLQERIKNYVRGESDRFVETKGAEGLYHIKRGKDGGCRLATEAYVKEYRELQAKKAAAAAK
jgi:hypothetical protein